MSPLLTQDGAPASAARSVLVSRNARPLTRYFPEVSAAVTRLGDVALDGELMIQVDGRASFPALMARLHPAASLPPGTRSSTPPGGATPGR